MSLSLETLINYFNLKLCEWEPFVESHVLELEMSTENKLYVSVVAPKILNFNITHELAQTLYYSFKSYREAKFTESDRIPYIVRNLSGVEIQVIPNFETS